jgi:sec-independent protein translocase protein TatA
MPNLGFPELLLILGIAVLLFGNRLPTIGKSLGEGIRNFKKGLNQEDGKSDDASQVQQPAPRQHASQQQVSGQSVAPGSLQSPQMQQTKGDYVDVEHRDSHK